MTDWGAASAAIAAAFADPEPIIYSCDEGELTISAIRSNMPMPDGAEHLIYEVQAADVPGKPTKQNSFAHRGVRWRITEVGAVEGVAAWALSVVGDGPSA